MEESKDLQTTYKIFRTFIYVSLVLEFFEYAIDPNVIDHGVAFSWIFMIGLS